jgi:hypothetical protein
MSSVTKKRALITVNTPLCDVPREWIKLIEPKIIRPTDSACWLWTGATDKDGEPVFTLTVILDSREGKTRKLLRAKRVIADMFWQIARHIEIVHECGTLNCLNPSHFYLSAAHWTQEVRVNHK